MAHDVAEHILQLSKEAHSKDLAKEQDTLRQAQVQRLERSRMRLELQLLPHPVPCRSAYIDFGTDGQETLAVKVKGHAKFSCHESCFTNILLAYLNTLMYMPHMGNGYHGCNIRLLKGRRTAAGSWSYNSAGSKLISRYAPPLPGHNTVDDDLCELLEACWQVFNVALGIKFA